MANPALSIRFFWGVRRESRAVCTGKLLSFLEQLRHFAPVFDHNWYPPRKDPDNPRHAPLKLNKTGVDALLKKSVNKTDVPIRGSCRPIRELGYTGCLLSDGYQRVSLRVQCGVYTPYLKNSLIINLPNSGAAGAQVFRATKLLQLFRIIVECWDPDVGQVWSTQLSDAIGESPTDLQVGWLSYVAFRIRQLPKLVRPIETVFVDKVGAVIVVTKQRFNIENPRHVERLRALSKRLNSPQVITKT